MGLKGVYGTELTEVELGWFVEYQATIIDSYTLQFFPLTHPSTLFAFSCQMYTNLTYLQRKTLKQLVRNSRKKDKFVVYTFEGLQFIFYKDELKVCRKMCLPLGTWSSAALVTPECKQKYGVNSGPQKISRRLQFSAEMVENING